MASIKSSEGQVNYLYDAVTGRKVRMWTGTADPTNATEDTGYYYNTLGQLTGVITLVLDGTRYGSFVNLDPTTNQPILNSTTHEPTWSGGLVTSYRYDAAGNLTGEQQKGDSTQTTYTYDSENRLLGLTVVSTATYPNTPIFDESYKLYDNGQRNTATDTRYNADGTVFSLTPTTWHYDNDGRLTSESLAVQNDGTGQATDANGQAPAPYTNVFKFDLDGNRTQETLDTNGDGVVDDTINYTYNSNNQLGTETETRNSDSSTVYSITSGYDNAGNLTSQVRTGTNAESDSYTWDLRGRMVTATVNGTTTTYTYDTDGVRTSETTGTSPTTYYLNDPNNPTGYTKAVEQWVSSSGRANAVLGMAFVLGLQVEAQADGGHGVLYLVHDGHGNTRLLLSSTRTIAEQYNFDAYGNLLASNGAQANAANALTPWLQGDGLYDSATGWNYNLARWRDGFHWTSMDPTVFGPGELANSNLVSYARADPIDNTDPSGRLLEQITVSGLILGIVAATGTLFLSYEGSTFLSEHHWGSYAGMSGGVDISSQLVNLRKNIFYRWTMKNSAQQHAIINSVTSLTGIARGWDISQLYGDEKLAFGSGPGEIPGSVTVKGNAYWADEVNYYLYGIIAKLSDDLTGRFDLAQWMNRITLYRTWGWAGTNIPGRRMWALAGYLGSFANVPSVAIPGAIGSKVPYSGNLGAHINTYSPSTRASGTYFWADDANPNAPF